jgi:hypothetical protein
MVFKQLQNNSVPEQGLSSTAPFLNFALRLPKNIGKDQLKENQVINRQARITFLPGRSISQPHSSPSGII